jgi:hypothetical protein
MRKLFLLFLIVLFAYLSSIASDKVLTTIGIDDIDAGGVYSRANIGTYFNANVFYAFYPAFYSPNYGTNVQRIKAHKMLLKSDGTVEKHEQTDLNDICFPAACAYAQSKLYLIGHDNNGGSGSLVIKSFDGSNWSGATAMPATIKSNSGIALTELNNMLFLFFRYTDGSIKLST